MVQSEIEPQLQQEVIPTRAPERYPGSHVIGLRLNSLPFLRGIAQQYGDVVVMRFLYHDVLLINDPEIIREVLVTRDSSFAKGPGLRVAERLLGYGLLTSEGDFHRRQRRLAQPAFHRSRVRGYAGTMVEAALDWQQRWHPGAELNLTEEMGGLALRIAAKTLFDTEVEAEIGAIADALTEALRLWQWASLPFAPKLERFLPFLTRRFNTVRDRLDQIVCRIITERRATGEDRGDLLSMLLLAEDEDGGRMSDLQVRDEAMTLLLAGHETTANAMSWTWYLLAQNPEAEARLHAELDQVLGGRAPDVEDVPRLEYTRMVFAESMRCYPPAWVVARQAIEDCQVGGLSLPEGSLLLMSEWVTHHDPRFFPEPFAFRPERWTPEEIARRPRFSYYPFGGGSRLCIGEQFAWMEGVLLLAALASRWRFRLSPGHRVIPQPVLTLRPRYGVRAIAERR